MNRIESQQVLINLTISIHILGLDQLDHHQRKLSQLWHYLKTEAIIDLFRFLHTFSWPLGWILTVVIFRQRTKWCKNCAALSTKTGCVVNMSIFCCSNSGHHHNISALSLSSLTNFVNTKTLLDSSIQNCRRRIKMTTNRLLSWILFFIIIITESEV